MWEIFARQLEIAEIHCKRKFGEEQLARLGGVAQGPGHVLAADGRLDRCAYQMWLRASPGNLERMSRSRAWSPESAWASPTADLKSCSNLAWSWAVINDRRMVGILLDLAGTGGGSDWAEALLRNESAICADVMPVGGGGGGGCCCCCCGAPV